MNRRQETLRSRFIVEVVLIALAERYADQNDRDYEAFLEKIRSGRLEN